jgi:hypothetical protein
MRQCSACQLWVDESSVICKRCGNHLSTAGSSTFVRRVSTKVLTLSIITLVFVGIVMKLMQYPSFVSMALTVIDSVAFLAISGFVMRDNSTGQQSEPTLPIRKHQRQYDLCLVLAYLSMLLFAVGYGLSNSALITVMTGSTGDLMKLLVTFLNGLFFVVLSILGVLFISTTIQDRKARPRAIRRRIIDLLAILAYFVLIVFSAAIYV